MKTLELCGQLTQLNFTPEKHERSMSFFFLLIFNIVSFICKKNYSESFYKS